MLQKYQTEMEYTNKLNEMKKQVALEYQEIVGRQDMSEEKLIKSLEAKVGSNLVDFARIKSSRYFSATEYRNAWIKGLKDSRNDEIKRFMKNLNIREYIILFLERSYLKNSKQYK